MKITGYKAIEAKEQNPAVVLNKYTDPTDARQIAKEDPSLIWTVDWDMSDADIARSLNLSRERVRQKRKEIGLPPSDRTRSVSHMLRVRISNAGNATKRLVCAAKDWQRVWERSWWRKRAREKAKYDDQYEN